MFKRFLILALALAVTGCANYQGSPQVRDVSEVRRNLEADAQYTVTKGDTLYGIAWEEGLDYRELAALNGIEPPFNIYPGQQLALPSSDGQGDPQDTQLAQADDQSQSSGVVATGVTTTSVQSAANVQSVANEQSAANEQEVDWLLPGDTGAEDTAQLEEARNAASEAGQQAMESQQQAAREASSDDSANQAAETPEATPEKPANVQAGGSSSGQASVDRSNRTYSPADNIDWQWPADGKVVGAFDDSGSITAGIDIAGQKGQPIKAAGPGIVVYAGSGVRGYGNLILIKHNNEFLSAYAHNDSLRVKENDVIEGGEIIATMGNSADDERATLHFEIRKDGQPEDPLTFLPGR